MTGDINNLCLCCLRYGLDERQVCRFCGSALSVQPEKPYHLPPRDILAGKYMVVRVLGEGGFGITYLGWDINLEIKVAIKEYYPGGFVSRDSNTTSAITTYGGDAETFFQKGRASFVEEARSLAKFHHLAGIVSVRDFFVENGTAYIVMDFVEGVTLKQRLEEAGGRLPEDEVLALMKPLVESLAAVHAGGVIHRDISPDNLMLTTSRQLKLLDFGAARAFNDNDRSLSVLLKPGYAPEEQYRSRGQQGPWTDIYALCATIYRSIEGEKPPEALERMMEDTFAGFRAPVRPSTAGAIARGLAVRAENRWQRVEDLYAALYPPAAQPAPLPPTPQKKEKPPRPAPPPPPAPLSAPGPSYASRRKSGAKAVPIIAAAAVVLVIITAAVLQMSRGVVPVSGGSGSGSDSASAVEDGFVVLETTPEGYGLSVRILDEAHAVIRLTDPELTPEYEVSAGEDGDHEYSWSVELNGGDAPFVVSTRSMGSDSLEDVSPSDMDTVFWYNGENGGEGRQPASFDIDANTLVWTIEVESDILDVFPDFSFYDFNSYHASVSRPDFEWERSFEAESIDRPGETEENESYLLGDVTPEGYSLSVDVIDDTHAVFYLTDPHLAEEYEVNVLEEGATEYDWGAGFSAYGREFAVGLTYISPGQAEGSALISPLDMYGSFWISDPEGAGDMLSIGEDYIPFAVDGDTILWTVEVPGEVLAEFPGFSFYDFPGYYTYVRKLRAEWDSVFLVPEEEATEAAAEAPMEAGEEERPISAVMIEMPTEMLEEYGLYPDVYADYANMYLAGGAMTPEAFMEEMASSDLPQEATLRYGNLDHDDMPEACWEIFAGMGEMSVDLAVVGDSYYLLVRFDGESNAEPRAPAAESAAATEAPMEGAYTQPIWAAVAVLPKDKMDEYGLEINGYLDVAREFLAEGDSLPEYFTEQMLSLGIPDDIAPVPGYFESGDMPAACWEVLSGMGVWAAEMVQVGDTYYLLARFD